MEVIYEMPPENEIPKTLDTNLSEDDLEMNVKDKEYWNEMTTTRLINYTYN